MKRTYRVTFDTKKNGLKHWVIDVEAESEKDARCEATDLWYWEKVATTSGTFSQYNMKATPIEGEIKFDKFTRT